MYRIYSSLPDLLSIAQGVVADTELRDCKVDAEQWTRQPNPYMRPLPYTEKFEKNRSSDEGGRKTREQYELRNESSDEREPIAEIEIMSTYVDTSRTQDDEEEEDEEGMGTS